MKILVVDNYPGTRLGNVGRALEEAGATIDLRVMRDGSSLPEDTGGHDGLVVLGGGQNALADEAHPYLPHLAGLTRRFGESDKAVLGICLGSQIVARGHGGRNILGRPIEFGWHPVRATAAGFDDPVISPLGDGAPLFHWHNDTFELPPGAAHLARSDATAHQAFRIGRAVYGIQFHFEASREVVAGWLDEFGGEIDRDVPGYRDRHAEEAARHGPEADRVGLEIARAWARLVRG